jgi:class 3 adenylate cyclase
VTKLQPLLLRYTNGGQILVPARVLSAVEDLVDAEEIGPLALKGFSRSIPTFNIIGLKPSPPAPA